MNILFLTQSITLKVFYDLMFKLKESHPVDNVGGTPWHRRTMAQQMARDLIEDLDKNL